MAQEQDLSRGSPVMLRNQTWGGSLSMSAMGPGLEEPQAEEWVHPPVETPPAGGAVGVQCSVDCSMVVQSHIALALYPHRSTGGVMVDCPTRT